MLSTIYSALLLLRQTTVTVGAIVVLSQHTVTVGDIAVLSQHTASVVAIGVPRTTLKTEKYPEALWLTFCNVDMIKYFNYKASLYKISAAVAKATFISKKKNIY